MTGKHLVVVGGSDAGIAAAMRARQLDPGWRVTVFVADAFPNFSICGIPYFLSGEVGHWRNLAHRSMTDLEATGMVLLLETRVVDIDTSGRRLIVQGPAGAASEVPYDALVLGTGAVSARPPIPGLTGPAALGPGDGVHLLHSMGDSLAVAESISTRQPATAVIIGAGYIGLEMAESLTALGIRVTQIEALPEVLPTVDPQLGRLVRTELETHGVQVHTSTTVTGISRQPSGALDVDATGTAGPLTRTVDLVLVVVGVRPDTTLAAAAGAGLGAHGAIAVDEGMRTTLPGIFAAGDCATTHHRMLGPDNWLPLGTTAHKQGLVAGENAIGGHRVFAGSMGTQVVKVFDVVAARTGLRDVDASSAGRGWHPVTVTTVADDHKAYYPGATPITLAVTGDRSTGRLLGAQLIGRRGAEIAKRVDTFAAALFSELTVDQISDLDLSYTPPLGSPWDAVQIATQTWTAKHQTQSANNVPESTGRQGDPR